MKDEGKYLGFILHPSSFILLFVAAAEVGGDVAKHGTASGVTVAHAADLDLTRRIQIDFVLQDFLNDDRHFIAATHLDERPSAGVQRYHALLDQRRKLEAATHLVDDALFLQFIQHYCSLSEKLARSGRGPERPRTPDRR